MKTCLNCGNKLIGKQKKYCSHNCACNYWTKTNYSYYQKNKEKMREYMRKYYKIWRRKNPDKFRETLRRYRQKHPEKFAIYQKNKKDKSNLRIDIINILGNKCMKCNSTDNLEIHHLTYPVTKINDLIILCKKCHIDTHNKKFNI